MKFNQIFSVDAVTHIFLFAKKYLKYKSEYYRQNINGTKWRFQADIDIKTRLKSKQKNYQIKTLLRLLDASQLQITDVNANQPDAVTTRLCQAALIDMSGENTIQSRDFNVCMRTACLNEWVHEATMIFIAAWQELSLIHI